MKKVLVLVLTMALTFSCAAFADDFDFSGLSLAELVEIQKKLTMAIWETEEWQEVTVPSGVYEIGVDIPAGHWTISAVNYAVVTWGKALDESKTDMEYKDEYASEWIGKNDDVESVSWELTDGTFLIVENGDVIFTPFSGVSLGFK